jgi:hypothetical protein
LDEIVRGKSPERVFAIALGLAALVVGRRRFLAVGAGPASAGE